MLEMFLLDMSDQFNLWIELASFQGKLPVQASTKDKKDDIQTGSEQTAVSIAVVSQT